MFLNFRALTTVLRFTFKVLAIAFKDIFNKYNSSIFEDNFWYNGVRCNGSITILTCISDAVRIGRRRVRQFLSEPSVEEDVKNRPH